jgi:DNA-binding response OmpR family regulator
MKRNILLVADGDIESDLDIVDAASRTEHGVRRASARSRPSQILRRNLKNIDAVIVDLEKHSQALSIVEALGCSEDMPPVIVLSDPKMSPLAYRHGATVCITKPFSTDELASVISSVCLYAHRLGVEHPLEAISIRTPKASLRAPPD